MQQRNVGKRPDKNCTELESPYSIRQGPVCLAQTGPCTEKLWVKLFQHQNFSADMSWMQVAAVGKAIALRGVKHIARRDADVLRLSRLQHQFGLHHEG